MSSTVRFTYVNRLEAAFKRSIFLNVFAVFVQRGRADGAQLATRQRGLEHVGGIDRPFRCSCSDQRMQFVDEEDDLAFRLFDFLQHSLQAVFELAAILRAGQHGSEIERDHSLVLQNFRNVARDDALGEAFDDGRLADAGLANQHRIVLRAPRKHLYQAADFFVAADHGVELAAPGLLGQVASITLQRLVFRLRILVSHFLRPADGSQRFQNGVIGRAMAGKMACAASRLAWVAASSRCSVETYSSLKLEASLKARSINWVSAGDMLAWVAPSPDTLGRLSISR